MTEGGEGGERGKERGGTGRVKGGGRGEGGDKGRVEGEEGWEYQIPWTPYQYTQDSLFSIGTLDSGMVYGPHYM